MDYMYPSVFFAYFLFALLTALTFYFCVRCARHGYWGRESEEPAHRMMRDDDDPEGRNQCL